MAAKSIVPTSVQRIRAGVELQREQAPRAESADKGFVLDARRVAAIHARQHELRTEIAETETRLQSLLKERETLCMENVSLHKKLADESGPEAWLHAGETARR